jgi:hypothetical protein
LYRPSFYDIHVQINFPNIHFPKFFDCRFYQHRSDAPAPIIGMHRDSQYDRTSFNFPAAGDQKTGYFFLSGDEKQIPQSLLEFATIPLLPDWEGESLDLQDSVQITFRGESYEHAPTNLP